MSKSMGTCRICHKSYSESTPFHKDVCRSCWIAGTDNLKVMCYSCGDLFDGNFSRLFCSEECRSIILNRSFKNKMKQGKTDVVNEPEHYKVGGIETIDYIKSKLTKEQYQGYLTGNVLKYISRYQHKNGTEDLQKAETYLKWLIEHQRG